MVILDTLDTSTGTALQCAAAVLGSAVDLITLLNIIVPSAAMYPWPDSAEQPDDSDSSAEQPDHYCSRYDCDADSARRWIPTLMGKCPDHICRGGFQL